MSTDTKKLEFDSKKYAVIAYDHTGAPSGYHQGDDHHGLISWGSVELCRLRQLARDVGADDGLPTWESYTRDRDVRKLVEEAYAKGLADGKAGK